MNLRQRAMRTMLVGGIFVAGPPAVLGQSHPETFTATATLKTAGAAAASAPITIVVDRKMSQNEADSLTAAFKAGGAAALRKALVGMPTTGAVQLAGGTSAPTRMTLERVTEKGRLLTIVTDQPILFLGGSMPQAKSREGYEFGIIDIEVDSTGSGSGTLAPAAKVTVRQGAIVVDDYGSEVVRLIDVKKVK
jgi:hypothetical protein